MIVHLISSVEGTVSRINHEEEIRSLPSFVHMHLEPGIGDAIVKTVNIRTDSGYVLLQHHDPEVVEADFRRVVELQSTIFEVEEVMDDLDSGRSICGISPNIVQGNYDSTDFQQNEDIQNQEELKYRRMSERVQMSIRKSAENFVKGLKSVDIQALTKTIATKIHRSNALPAILRIMQSVPVATARVFGKTALLVALYALMACTLALLSTSPLMKNIHL
jgi:hypothetical protein